MSWRWEKVNEDWVAIPIKRVKPNTYIDALIQKFGGEVIYEIMYGLPPLERETVENQRLP